MTQDEKVLIQDFARRLNAEPNPAEFEKTPDNRASYLPISFVEMTLDEIFLGQWELSDVTYQQIFNEVVGTGILTVWHPITGRAIRRAGFGAVVITQDKDAAMIDFNTTKKKNALDLTFPKLKAEIVKNAAQSLGKVFGRDINRKQKDVFKPALQPIPAKALQAAVERAEKGDFTVVALAKENFLLSPDDLALLEGAEQTKRLGNG